MIAPLENLCPCGSATPYVDCCGLYIEGSSTAPTPEALMRSRYTAYTLAQIDYIKKTIQGQALTDFDFDQSLAWAKAAEWDSLTVLQAPTPSQDKPGEGFVEFKAYYRLNGVMKCLHENSRFIRDKGAWFYVGNASYRVTDSEAHKAKKVGRNDPCLCGSGKKYKKCCGL